jgi:hypothetical protein
VESLKVAVYGYEWQGEIEVIQWQELLHPFTAVKEVTLKEGDSIQLVAPALQELSVESATGVLPALQSLFLNTEDWWSSGPDTEAIEQFIAAQRLHGHPVTVHYWDWRSRKHVQ